VRTRGGFRRSIRSHGHGGGRASEGFDLRMFSRLRRLCLHIRPARPAPPGLRGNPERFIVLDENTFRDFRVYQKGKGWKGG
jgi:hypothetical protein